MGRRVRPQVGDVFTLPLSDDRIGFGQVVAEYGTSGSHFYFVIYRDVHDRAALPDVARVPEGEIALFALSMDALLHHQHWVIRGNERVPDHILWPLYKESTAPGEWAIRDYTGKRIEPATESAVEDLPYLTVVAPIRLQNALEALHGLKPWDSAYDELLVAQTE